MRSTPPPAFAAVSARDFTEGPTNGVLPRGAYSIPSRNKATIAPTKINQSALAMGLNGGFNFPEIALNGKSPFDLIKNVRALAVRHFCSHKFTCR